MRTSRLPFLRIREGGVRSRGGGGDCGGGFTWVGGERGRGFVEKGGKGGGGWRRYSGGGENMGIVPKGHLNGGRRAMSLRMCEEEVWLYV